MIAIIDYGMGNLRSVQKAFEHAGYEAAVTGEVETIKKAKAVVLPGVGAFAQAMYNLRAVGMDKAVMQVIREGRPFLGICLGLQLLFDASEETFGNSTTVEGLGVIPGVVRRFPPGLKVPQIGWNQLSFPRKTPLYEGVPEGSYVYFVHSYYVDPEDFKVAASITDYGISFVSSVVKDNVWAIQFHPEKSSKVGLRILQNFGEWANGAGNTSN